jgi:uncharacterized protein (DUF2342 family)
MSYERDQKDSLEQKDESLAERIPVVSAIRRVIEHRRAERRLHNVEHVLEELGRLSLSN